jgi:hypothetical protein
VCVALLLLSPRAARSDETPERHVTPTAVIPPGQEDLFAAMLGRGAALPDGCAFVTGQIERAVVRGVYKCVGGEVVVELRHPFTAPRQAGHTEKIAIVTARGTPPAALLAALEERIRERESAFEWVWPKPTEPAPKEAASRGAAAKDAVPNPTSVCGAPAGPPGIFGSYAPDCYPRFAAVLVGIAQTMVMVLGLGYGLVQLYRTPSSSN